MTLTAEARTDKDLTALRAHGKIPAVVYGGKKEPQSITICEKTLNKMLSQRGFFTTVLPLNIDNKAEDVLPKALARHPVTDRIIHADFMRVQKGTTMRISVPIRFINDDKSIAIKRGGVLNVVVHSLEVRCSPYDIPVALTFDLSGIQMHDAVKLEALSLPKGVVPVHPLRDATLATIVAPTGLGEDEKANKAPDAAAQKA